MADSVNVGSLVADLKIDFEAGFRKLESRIGDIEARVTGFSRKTKSETDKIGAEYKKLAASLDPVVARTQKYEKAEETLTKALKAGVIQQAEFNKQLDVASKKFQSAQGHTLTWREEIHHLSGKITGLTGALGPLSGIANEVVEGFSRGASKAGVLGESIAALGPAAPILAGVAVAAAGIGIAFEAAKFGVEFLFDSIKEGMHTQVLIEQLNASLRLEGTTAGVSAKELIELAESLELVTGRNKEAIIPAETVLSRFNVSAQQMPRLVGLTLDYAQALTSLHGGQFNAADAAKRLGAAWDGDTRSLRSLKDLGIVFTKSERDALTQLVEHGKRVEYQAKLTEILEGKVKGLAAAYGSTLQGQIANVNTVLGEAKETIASEVIPALENLMSDVVDSFGGWEEFKRTVQDWAHVIGDSVRSVVYGSTLLFHQLAIELEKFDMSFREAAIKALEVAKFVATVTGQTAKSIAIAQAIDDLNAAQVKSAFAIERQAQAIAKDTEEFKKHKLALEGDSEAHNKAGFDIGDFTGKVSKEAKEVEKAINTLKRHREETKQAAQFALRSLIAENAGPKVAEKEKNLQEIENELLKEKQKLLEHHVDIRKKEVQETLNQIAGDIRQRQEYEKLLDIIRRAHKDFEQINNIVPTSIGTSIANAFNDLTDRLMKTREEISKAGLSAEETASKLKSATAQYLVQLQTIMESGGGPQFSQQSVMIVGKTGSKAIEDAWNKQMDELAASIRSHFRTIRDDIEDDMSRVILAASDAGGRVVSVAEKEKALWQLREEELSTLLGDFQNLLGFLGQFSGTIRQIGQAISNIQGAYNTGKGLDASGFGSSIGMSGAWGTVLAEVQIFYEVYKAVDRIIKKHRAQTWGTVTSLQAIDGIFSAASYFSEAGRAASHAIRATITELIASMGAVLDDMPEIAIRARKDGKEFSAYVAGVFVGVFRDAQAALDAAAAYAITHSSFAFIGQEMATVLKKAVGASLEELQQLISVAVSARTARLGDAGEAYVELASKWNAEIAAAREAGLAIDNMIRARDREMQSMVNAALGIDSSGADALRALQSLSAGMGEAAQSTRAFMEQQIAAIREQIAARERQLHSVGGGGVGREAGSGGFGGGESGQGGRGGLTKEGDAMDAELARLQAQLDEYIAQLDRVPEALSETQMEIGIWNVFEKYLKDNKKYEEERLKIAKLKVEYEFELIKAQLILMGKWEEWQATFNDAYNAAMNLATGKTGKGSGKGSGKDSVRDFIRDRTFDLDARAMSAYARSIAETRREYDKQIEQAGKDKKLRAELIALRDRELAQMAAERANTVNRSYNDFLGLTTQFDKIGETAHALIDDLNDSPLGDAERAAKISNVLLEMSRQMDELAAKSAQGLLSEMAGDLEKFGAAEQLQLEARKAAAILEHTLKLEHYRTEIEILRATGRVSKEVLNTLDSGLAALASIDPTKIIGGASGASSGDTSAMTGGHWESTGNIGGWRWVPDNEGSSGVDLISQAKDLLSHYTEQAKDSLTQELDKIAEDFTKIETSLGKTPEVLAAKNAAIAAAVDKFLEPVERLRAEMKTGGSSVLSKSDQFAGVRSQFQALSQSFTLSDRDKLIDLATQYRELVRGVSGGEAVRFVDKEVDTVLKKFEELAKAQAQGSTGTSAKPTTVESPTLKGSIEAGNTLILAQQRMQTEALKSIDATLGMLATQQSPFDTRKIA